MFLFLFSDWIWAASTCLLYENGDMDFEEACAELSCAEENDNNSSCSSQDWDLDSYPLPYATASALYASIIVPFVLEVVLTTKKRQKKQINNVKEHVSIKNILDVLLNVYQNGNEYIFFEFAFTRKERIFIYSLQQNPLKNFDWFFYPTIIMKKKSINKNSFVLQLKQNAYNRATNVRKNHMTKICRSVECFHQGKRKQPTSDVQKLQNNNLIDVILFLISTAQLVNILQEP
ncbi:hypothetical protein RFI_13135 [Reticulomyxa filosa]|uniref:Uncharacterized protein n=1 Tax=Reticulomyxa filosa TaxID=46433 RepID=X6NCJ1_RETFI|nr:hypothetical protein RFI_13135 [Reticulomyxa filosa]|eukprot:ETO24025.1 hypothetical protein RFI_13135 [Reticulomyxa filosa]